MNNSLIIMDKALGIAAKELAYLQEGETGEAETCASERALLLKEAWEAYNEEDADSMRQKLLQMQEIQETLLREAKELRLHLQEELRIGKEKAVCHRGYSSVLTSTAKFLPAYMDKKT